MPKKLITNHKCLDYFTIIHKQIGNQVNVAEFSSGFYFFIFYRLDKEKQKVDSLIHSANHFLLGEYNDRWQ